MGRVGFALAVVACIALAIGCTGEKRTLAALAEGCALNTDCDAPLVCAFRRCHAECTASRDCPASARCVESDRPYHVCQLAEERDCSYNSDCPSGQFCAVDSQCRDECHADRDCVKDQVCVGGTCADPAELVDGGLSAPVADSGAEAGGQPCLYTSECPVPLVCKSRLCARECFAAADCRQGYDCVDSRCASGPGTVIGPEGGAITAMAGKIKLAIPPGSLQSPVSIQILDVEAWPAGALGPVFQLEPTGLRFDFGATLTYRFTPADIGKSAPGTLRIATAAGAKWSPLPSTVDVASGSVSAQLAHLSIYGVVGPDVADAGLDATGGSKDDVSVGGDAGAPDGAADCNGMSCSGAVGDGCCPSACTATTDVDCTGCGNGRIDPGETCDPVDDCPTVCPPIGCQLFTLANADTCQAACITSGQQMACANGDGCCPSGCDSRTDSDCPAACGNGVVDPGEICDGNCPSRCDPVGCQQRALQGSAATCDARCVNGAVQTACAPDDACCPAGCDTATDVDCVPRCGNGIVESGEICDGNCPASCPPIGCQLQAPDGTPEACNVQCANAGLQTACINNDACCPAGCNAINDNDCAPACGNGVRESGETCDPPSACTAVQAACTNDANTVVTTSGSAANCTFVCTRRQRACGAADGFCPTNVACGPATDVDCPGCGNGRLETGETCDPPSACSSAMAACVSDPDNVRTSSGGTASCTYRCTTTPRTCGPADGFCPTGCGPATDVDCPGCGNGRIEAGETCDVAPASPACASITCDDGNTCTTDTRRGSNAACNVTCAHANITACINADGCCPSGCNSINDNDCGAVCGNGVREGAETCEVAPGAPLCTSITCDDGDACTTDARTGSNAACNVACSHAAVTTCSLTSDGCCPPGCNANNDVNCAAACGNGVVEGNETCDVAPARQVCTGINCDDGNACTTDVRNGSNAACNVTCSHTAITACSLTGDGCCPAGCNANNDVNCAAVCGNGVVEPPAETCDTGIARSCPTSCPQKGCSVLTLVNAGTCSAQCVDQGLMQTTCADGDGCCPAGCTDFTDTDCATPNDVCAQATDISAGGDFPFSLMTAAEETPGFCTANGPEVFFKFQVAAPSAVYLDVFDASGKVVDVALELYANTCPAAGAQPIACDASTGQKACGSAASWPRIFLTNSDIRTYVVAARALNGVRSRNVLRFQRVPLGCIGGGPLAFLSTTSTVVSTTCTQADQVAPTCQTGGQDRTYYYVKCPASGLSLDTCSGRTGVTDTILQINEGSIDLVAGTTRCVLAPSGRALACNDDAPANSCLALPDNPHSSIITNSGRKERGIFTFTVDSFTKPGCGSYGLDFIELP